MTISHVIQKMAAISGSGVARGGAPELKNRKLKEKAVAFYAQHNVPAAIEKLLNGMFLAAPSDVYGYMSEYFHGLSKEPVISALSACEVLDSSGGKALEVELYCTINGVQKLMSTAGVSLDPYPPPPNPSTITTAGKGGGKLAKGSKANLQKTAEQPELASDDKSQPLPSENFVEPIISVTKHIATAVKGISPKEQRQVDDTLVGLLNAEREQKLHPSCLQATSFVTAIAGASLLKFPLYLHLANTYFPETQRFTMPTPVVSVLTGGHLGCGKLKIREFCLTPLPGITFPEQIRSLLTVYQEVGKVLSAKSGPSAQGSFVTTGAYCPAMDRVEQALDLLQEATRNAGMQLNQDVGVMVDIGAEKLYDQEKEKYEIVMGQWKSSEELISLYSDLLQSYPGILGYIDPLHHQDVGGWQKLLERLGSKCLLVADHTLKGLPLRAPGSTMGQPAVESGIEVKEKEDGEGTTEEHCITSLSCAALGVQPTLSETVQNATHLRGYSPYIMLLVPPNSTMNTVLADLAVALQCRFLRLTAPVGLTSSGILSQLLRIREDLIAKKVHEPIKAHVFMSASFNQEEHSRTASSQS